MQTFSSWALLCGAHTTVFTAVKAGRFLSSGAHTFSSWALPCGAHTTVFYCCESGQVFIIWGAHISSWALLCGAHTTVFTAAFFVAAEDTSSVAGGHNSSAASPSRSYMIVLAWWPTSLGLLANISIFSYGRADDAGDPVTALKEAE